MGLHIEGLTTQVTSTTIQMYIDQKHSYIQLANTLNWQTMYELVSDDLKKSTPAQRWWVGRPINVRTHLAIFILQALTKMTDRQTEEAIKNNGVYQLFCGSTIIQDWHCPDHTAIEKFRNRITAPTQQKLVSYVVTVARDRGFADASKMDVDSTVQEAAMVYPTYQQL
jgi:transposase